MGNDPTTRERLFAAALELFAERGYKETSTRDIAEAANANIASVNYHFGGKESLYKEVIRAMVNDRHKQRADLLKDAEERPGATIESIIAMYVRGHLTQMINDTDCSRDLPLLFREISSPGPGFEIIIEEMIKPTHKMFTQLFMKHYPTLTKEKAALCIASLMGQIMHFVKARKVLEKLIGREYDPETIEILCNHIVRVTIAGLEASK